MLALAFHIRSGIASPAGAGHSHKAPRPLTARQAQHSPFRLERRRPPHGSPWRLTSKIRSPKWFGRQHIAHAPHTAHVLNFTLMASTSVT